MRTVLAAAVLAALPLTSPAVADPAGFVGVGTTCGLLAAETTPGSYSGLLYSPAVGVDGPYDLINWHVLGNPVRVGVTCVIFRNGSPVYSNSTTGDAAAVFADVVTFGADDDDIVTVCTTWTLTDTAGTTQTRNYGCATADGQEVPPPVVPNTACAVAAEVPRVWSLFCGPAPVVDLQDLDTNLFFVIPQPVIG